MACIEISGVLDAVKVLRQVNIDWFKHPTHDPTTTLNYMEHALVVTQIDELHEQSITHPASNVVYVPYDCRVKSDSRVALPVGVVDVLLLSDYLRLVHYCKRYHTNHNEQN